MSHSREEVEAAFRTYFMTGPVNEDWVAWSQLFTDDATYFDHHYGTFRGPSEIEQFLERTLSAAPQLYTALVWYNIDGDQIVYKGLNRADNPEPGGPVFEFPSLQIITYAGNGKWSSEEDWWLPAEMAAFAKGYYKASQKFDKDHAAKMTRQDFGPWVDWARPEPGHAPSPSWLGKDLPVVRSADDLGIGERIPK